MNKIKRGQIKPRAKTIEIQERRKELLKKQSKKYNSGIIGQIIEVNEQNKKIENIIEKINRDAKDTVKFIRTSKFKQIQNMFNEYRNMLKTPGAIQKIYMIIIAATICLAIAVKVLTYDVELPHMATLENSQSVIEITMNKENNNLEYSVNEVAIKSKDRPLISLSNLSWLEKNIDTLTKSYEIEDKKYKIYKKTELNQLKINKDIVYIQYTNKNDTASKELIIAKEEPNILDTRDMRKINRRFKEKSNPIQVKTKANSYRDSFIMLTETLAGGKLEINSLKNEIVNIESLLGESDEYNGITLKFNELGEINLSKIDEIKESPEITYNKDTDILAVRNSSENIDYFYISRINNDNFGCYAENLIATTNENVFVHEDYDNTESIGYKTFAIKTDNNLYCFRLTEIAHESLQINIYKQLGIKTNKIEIKKVQTVIPSKN